jgi:hypothetical protein
MAGRRAEAATERDGLAGHASLREDYLNLLSETLKLLRASNRFKGTFSVEPSEAKNFERLNTPSECRAPERAASGL